MQALIISKTKYYYFFQEMHANNIPSSQCSKQDCVNLIVDLRRKIHPTQQSKHL